MSATKKAWRRGYTSSARHNEAINDLLPKFMARCDRENLTPASKAHYTEKLPKMLAFLVARGRSYWQQVTLTDIQEWISFTQQRDVSEHYKQGWVRVTKTFLRWIVDQGLEGHLSAIPVIHQLPGRQYIPSPQTLNAFLRTIDQDTVWGFRDYVVCMSIIDTGARINEICEMHVTDVLWDQGVIRLFGKGRKERFVPASSEHLFPILKKWIQVRDKYASGSGIDRLFVTRAGGACDPNTFSQMFRKHRVRTGIGNEAHGSLSAHTLRHYFATMYLVNGGKIEVLQRILGHEEITTTMRYLHLANRLGMVKDDHTKVSPLKNMMDAAAPVKKRRRMN